MPDTSMSAVAVGTRLGPMVAVLDSSGTLVQLDFARDWADGRPWRGHAVSRHAPAAAPVADQLGEYFAGDRRAFDLKLAPRGDAFRRSVWAELLRIPYGETRSYGEIARRVGRPGAARAVGVANATNPIAVVIPCHRVVGSDGRLVGYAAGLDIKRALLDLEHAAPPATAPAQKVLPLWR
ncbi:MAG TPA: methylated-DNA--[protein]-cysteine S-methyltransferase [Geminicoccaceae bacterium]|nr:methylated-DNA--[protein]-cysteine S-methyltransferase [Geminicoccaceae bacterium]